jgi:hypothetical protein
MRIRRDGYHAIKSRVKYFANQDEVHGILKIFRRLSASFTLAWYLFVLKQTADSSLIVCTASRWVFQLVPI